LTDLKGDCVILSLLLSISGISNQPQYYLEKG